jgi:sarcosine oxidase, subunit beta
MSHFAAMCRTRLGAPRRLGQKRGAGRDVRAGDSRAMKRYSVFAVAREAFRHHRGWTRAWASPEPRARYDAVIVGAGGHGLATAYYLGKNHGIRNVAILEKGWLGGGNTGRNTTIIRSNYLQDPSAAIYEKVARSTRR